MKISDHVTWREGTFSANAVRLGLDNTPSDIQVRNIIDWATHVFEPLRLKANCPITIDVVYRSGKTQRTNTGILTSVNEQAGGEKLSQHRCEGGDAAGDLDNDNHPDRLQNNDLFILAYNNLEVNYDQAIAENIDETGHVSWLHLSYNNTRKQRRNALVSFFINEKGKQVRKYRLYDISKGFIRSHYLNPGEI